MKKVLTCLPAYLLTDLLTQVQPVVRTLSRGVPMKKLVLVVEMSMQPGGRVDPARFTSTLQETGLLD